MKAPGRRGALALPTFALLVLLCVPALAAPRHASILIDAASGKVLQADNADATTYPASLTKMMTLYLLFERLSKGTMTLGQVLTVSPQAAAQPPTNLNLEAGDTLTVDTAIRALIVRSANDVATVVAEAIAGSEPAFAKLMTAKARALGMSRTVFRNASGLPDAGQVTTARDLAKLARALVRDFPQYYPYFAVTRFSYAGRTYYGHNRLMSRYAGADGLKTGYIRASGYNLATSAVRNGHRLIGIVLGGDSPADRDRQMARLLDAGFRRLPAGGGELVAQAAPVPPRLPATPSDPLLAIPAVRPALSLSREQIAALAGPAVEEEIPLPILDKPHLDVGAPAGVVQVASAQTVATDAAEDDGTTDARATDRKAASSWTLQVGAFGRSAAAKVAILSASKAAPKLLADAEVRVEEALKGKSKIYRAQFVGLSERTAKAACQGLKAKDMVCIVLAPRVDIAEAPE
ncbi:MAG: D-alanyl-D-alanine carboxypeptidase [Rhodospirillaceae bacterium]|nr:D-alanyl-D-alanine carboxypeptidase [Rhodospirillaceae bacterium]